MGLLDVTTMKAINNELELEDALSTPTEGAIATLQQIKGDILVLGAGGKMGPTLARMLARIRDQLGDGRRILAASRFSDTSLVDQLRQHGVEPIPCDLTDREAIARLPDVPNVIFMAGQKFGTSDRPELTWLINVVVPSLAAERFRGSRFVVFSTGCVYPFVAVDGAGSREDDPLDAPGEYASTCVGRERIFTHHSRTDGTPVLIFRLNYAIDLRYGVLSDVATRVSRREPVDVTTGWVNVIWQGDANARAIQCLALADSPPAILNVTGQGHISIRELATRFGELLHREPVIVGKESTTAWLSNAERSVELLGPTTVTLDEMIDLTANWVSSGGALLGKPTHFDARDGRF